MRLSRKSIQRTFKVKKYLNPSFSCLHNIPTKFGINTQKSLISLNIQRSSRMKIIEEILIPIGKLNISKIGNALRVWLRRQNMISLIWRFRKYQIKSMGLCYNLNSVLSKRHTLILSNTRGLNRVPKYKCLPYIQTTDGPCYTPLALPSWPCIYLEVDMC